jgi:hypothetical protein
MERRTPPITLLELLDESRMHLQRLTPLELAALVTAAQPALCNAAAPAQTAQIAAIGAEAPPPRRPLILDTRTPTDRALYGCIPSSIHTPRTVLEWRVAMDAPLRLAQVCCHRCVLSLLCCVSISAECVFVSPSRRSLITTSCLSWFATRFVDWAPTLMSGLAVSFLVVFRLVCVGRHVAGVCELSRRGHSPATRLLAGDRLDWRSLRVGRCGSTRRASGLRRNWHCRRLLLASRRTRLNVQRHVRISLFSAVLFSLAFEFRKLGVWCQ